MFFNESPFYAISKNIHDNNIKFHNDSSNNPTESNSDFFSIEDKNKPFNTKGRFGFYNNGTPSQIKQYIDYFLNESDSKINLICFTGEHFPLNLNKSENENPKKMNNLSSNFNNQKSSINSNMNNNSKKMNEEIIEDEQDNSCPAPLCKKSFNSNLSGSTFNSSYNSNNNNNNLSNEKNEEKMNSFINEFGKMEINEKKMVKEKKNKFNPYMSGRVLKLKMEY